MPVRSFVSRRATGAGPPRSSRKSPILALALVLAHAASVSAADRLIEGVPLPDESLPMAETGAAGNSVWSGIWVGAWGGTMKHILLVGPVAPDGATRVVHAIADNPWMGTRRAWSRHDASVTGGRLIIAELNFSVSYERDDRGRVMATYRRGTVATRAGMTKIDVATLTEPGAARPWTSGKSEMLRTALIEDGRPVDLEAVVFRPSSPGPFPLAVFNHGSTGNGVNPALFTETVAEPGIAMFLNDRGWLVAFPQRRGRGRSGGLYDEGFGAARANGYTCDFDVSLAGADRALEDIAAAVTALRQRPEVTPGRILMGGQSRGGILSVAYAGMHPEQIAGVINIVGGWISDGCDTAARLNGTLFARGGPFGRPTIWLYGEGDRYYALSHSRHNFEVFQQAGGLGAFLAFDAPGGVGHAVLGTPALWQAPIAAYLDALPPPP